MGTEVTSDESDSYEDYLDELGSPGGVGGIGTGAVGGAISDAIGAIGSAAQGVVDTATSDAPEPVGPGDVTTPTGTGSTTTYGSSGGGYGYSSGGYSEPNRFERLTYAGEDLYFQLWGEYPPPGYIKNLVKKGLNLFEIEEFERRKPAFKKTKTYKDEYAAFAQMVAGIMGKR